MPQEYLPTFRRSEQNPESTEKVTKKVVDDVDSIIRGIDCPDDTWGSADGWEHALREARFRIDQYYKNKKEVKK